jgi:hypothetical protein
MEPRVYTLSACGRDAVKVAVSGQSSTHLVERLIARGACRVLPPADAPTVSLADFVVDHLDRESLADDVVSMTLFAKSLSPEERQAVVARLEAPPRALPPLPEAPPEPASSAPTHALEALASLGFPRGAVDSWAAGFDASGLSAGDVVKAGCRALAGKLR